MSPAELALIGNVLDKYEVLQKVGEGGMATVYRGRHTTLGREVAIKVLHPHLSSSARNRKRFAREARAIEHLKHPNILEIFDYSGAENDDCYIVTEFVRGETLADVLARVGRMPSEAATLVGLDLAKALQFAHQHNVLHRDLKPDNVMMREDGALKLMDFGIARFLDESQVTMTGALVGSPAYMSPEQAKEGPLDARSDLFSLGTVLFFLVTGQLPFTGNNPSVILKKIIEGNRPSVTELAPDMSAALADVIERLLASEKYDRFDEAGQVIEGLERALEEVGLPEPRFSLVSYLSDSASWTRSLEDHLRATLIERGKSRLATGDTLAALRLFNRLLSIDADNEEVIALVQGLHVEPAAPPSRRYRGLAVAGAGAVVAALVFGPMLNWSPKPSPAAPIADAGEVTAAIVADGAVTAPPAPPPPEPAPEDPPDPPKVKVKGLSAARLPPVIRPPREAPLLPQGPSVAPDKPGRVTFMVTGEGWADVYCDRKKVTDTRPPDNSAEFPPGSHRCRYSSPNIFDEDVEFTVAPGESVVVSRALRARPLVVAIDASCADACEVSLDGASAGTVGALGRTLSIERPGEAHQVEVRCGDQRYGARYTGVPRPLRCRP